MFFYTIHMTSAGLTACKVCRNIKHTSQPTGSLYAFTFHGMLSATVLLLFNVYYLCIRVLVIADLDN